MYRPYGQRLKDYEEALKGMSDGLLFMEASGTNPDFSELLIEEYKRRYQSSLAKIAAYKDKTDEIL